jgi:hypothetical protein
MPSYLQNHVARSITATPKPIASGSQQRVASGACHKSELISADGSSLLSGGRRDGEPLRDEEEPSPFQVDATPFEREGAPFELEGATIVLGAPPSQGSSFPFHQETPPGKIAGPPVQNEERQFFFVFPHFFFESPQFQLVDPRFVLFLRRNETRRRQNAPVARRFRLESTPFVDESRRFSLELCLVVASSRTNEEELSSCGLELCLDEEESPQYEEELTKCELEWWRFVLAEPRAWGEEPRVCVGARQDQTLRPVSRNMRPASAPSKRDRARRAGRSSFATRLTVDTRRTVVHADEHVAPPRVPLVNGVSCGVCSAAVAAPVDRLGVGHARVLRWGPVCARGFRRPRVGGGIFGRDRHAAAGWGEGERPCAEGPERALTEPHSEGRRERGSKVRGPAPSPIRDDGAAERTIVFGDANETSASGTAAKRRWGHALRLAPARRIH